MNKFHIFIIIILIFSLLLKNIPESSNPYYIYPTYETDISSYFGHRKIFGSTNFHNGIDFPVPEGTAVYATQSGFVKSCSFIKGYGMSIIVQNYDGNKVLYAHLSESFIVNSGDNVIQGQKIATVGPKYLSNGNLNGLTTGPHLHFTIYNDKGVAIDPLTLNLIQKMK